MKAEDIKTSADLEAWLNGLPEDQAMKVAPQIAHRAAMRFLPYWAEHCARSREDDLTVIPVFWCHLLNAVSYWDRTAFKNLGRDAAARGSASAARSSVSAYAVSTASTAYASAAYAYAAAASTAASTAYASAAYAAAYASDASAASAAAYASDAAAASTAASTAYASAAYASAAASAAAAAFASDAAVVEKGADLTGLPLWPDGADPLAAEWANAAPLFERHPAWAVFKDLYENTLHARPQNWPLLTALAQKDEAFWTGKDEEVLDRIAEVMEGFERQRLLEETRALKSTIEAALPEGAASEFKRSHNNPPELIEDAPPPEQILIIWAGLDDVEHELENPKPDKKRLQELLSWLRKPMLVVALIASPIWASFGTELGKDIYAELITNGRLTQYISNLEKYLDGNFGTK